ncbi:msmX [Mytilus coruscus]|uniref:MsmX n=1 Tax=Mytilus coruscus TaxID=42192 RepID=A0A6J8C1J1_MYTCO|nr:msmX [Mytilus coruscus]
MFNKWWDETSKAIIQLGGTSFTERCSLWKVGRLDRNDRDILIEIRNMIGTFDPVPKGVRKICESRILEWDKDNVAQTRAMKRLTEMIELHNVAIAVGPSGCGKSTAIHFIALQLARIQDYDIIIVSSPEEMKNYYDPDSKQIFVMHNVFGASTFEQNKAMKWLEMRKDIKIMLDSNRVKLLVSCKTHVFQQRIVKKIDVLSETSCDFLASNYCLTDDERLNIANLYLTKDEIRLLKSSNAWSQFCFFPLLCQCYSRRKSCNVVDYFKYPIESVSADLSSMESFDQTALATLFLFAVYNNCIKESSLTEITKIEPIHKVISRNFDLKSQLSIQVVKK